ncbi:ATPase [Actinoplanes sp. SE50]|uniref:SRPBCC family protein n=1 Tax=unclassified Actinoplanes TaxID=2626549 RepID=UPI00023ECEC6|nr:MULTISPECIES: SRPBCC family protein [unclassified Actinoplanes]AEV85491.1 activator of HSP90 ATPase 1 family protein [Actinoplanes sp. SE50/110]ATO83884.1 ATPase [Actinoplanes sp. SE50]SLM01294.1 ATPase [Actinoplanes sp. SE50/110]
MSPTPTGRLLGDDLVLTRTFRAPIDDVWASMTESDRTARWFGPWRGEPGPGRVIKVQMAHEEGRPWMDMTIDACEPPRRLAVCAGEETDRWRLEMTLAEAAGVTTLTFTQHLTTLDGVGEVGPGWEYYLDALVAARADAPMPSFDDYYPSLKEHYESQR